MSEAERACNGRPCVWLASASPRRRAILEELGISYRLLTVEADEIVADTPCRTVEENAVRKLTAGLRIAERGAVVVAADTVLETQGRVLGKPGDEAAAQQYLEMLSGGCAVACSAVAVAVAAGDGGGAPGAANRVAGALATETAEVRFKVLPPEIVRWYLSTGEPMGRAGAFGIGQFGEVLTESVDGSYSCVSGLPKAALIAALARAAGERMPGPLRDVPAGLPGRRVQLRPLIVEI